MSGDDLSLNRLEWHALESWVRKLPPNGAKLGVANLNPNRRAASLRAASQNTLDYLLRELPSGKLAKLHSPVLKSVRHKVKQARSYAIKPHRDPEQWPKIFRIYAAPNAEKGLLIGPGGQVIQQNLEGLPVRLGQTHRWSSTRGGPLVMMGPPAILARHIMAAGAFEATSAAADGAAGDVNMEFDRMYDPYGDMNSKEDQRLSQMPLYVSAQASALYMPTDKAGEVVLDQRTELVQLAASAFAGMLGGGVQHSGFMEYVSAGVDVLSTGKDMADNIRGGGGAGLDKTRITLIVDMVPHGPHAVDTRLTTLDQTQLQTYSQQALRSLRGL